VPQKHRRPASFDQIDVLVEASPYGVLGVVFLVLGASVTLQALRAIWPTRLIRVGWIILFILWVGGIAGHTG